MFLPLAFLLMGSVTTNMLQVVARKNVDVGGGGLSQDSEIGTTTPCTSCTEIESDVLSMGTITNGIVVGIVAVESGTAPTFTSVQFGTDESEEYTLNVTHSLTGINGELNIYIFTDEIGSESSGSKVLEVIVTEAKSEMWCWVGVYNGGDQTPSYTTATDAAAYQTTSNITTNKPDGDIALGIHGFFGDVSTALTTTDTEEEAYNNSGGMGVIVTSISAGDGSVTLDGSYTGDKWGGGVAIVIPAN